MILAPEGKIVHLAAWGNSGISEPLPPLKSMPETENLGGDFLVSVRELEEAYMQCTQCPGRYRATRPRLRRSSAFTLRFLLTPAEEKADP